jgi:hypothetical protein
MMTRKISKLFAHLSDVDVIHTLAFIGEIITLDAINQHSLPIPFILLMLVLY